MACSATPPADSAPADRWLTETARTLARGIAADRALDRLPILADALEDVGCDNFPLLRHLRSDDDHQEGCWALRRVLRTTLSLPGGVPLEFAYCPPGAFVMGTPADHDEDERPARRVSISHALHAGIFQVTQEQWRAVMGTDPSQFAGDRRPVEMVRWAEASEFCERVAAFTGRPVRLPTEAEWEYVARAGTTTEFCYGDDADPALMNCNEGPRVGQTTDAGSYPPNPWGLFDTHGNVMEWCADWYDADFYATATAVDPANLERGDDSREGMRCVRGGSWEYNAAGCRSALRNYRHPNNAESCLGFRVLFTDG